jgi:hypothetical protein
MMPERKTLPMKYENLPKIGKGTQLMQCFGVTQNILGMEGMEMHIPLIDLKKEYELYGNKIEKAVIDVLQSGPYIPGNNVKQFEDGVADYLDVNYAASVGNGTDALLLSLGALEIHFVDCIYSDTEPLVGVEEGAAAVEIALQIKNCLH